MGLAQGVLGGNLVNSAVSLLDHQSHLSVDVSSWLQKRLKSLSGNDVPSTDQFVVLLVLEQERQHSLLAQIRLGDSCNRASDDQLTAKEPGLQRGVLACRSLAVVVVSYQEDRKSVV